MLNIVWPIFIIISFSFAIFSGNLEKLNSSIFESTSDAINFETNWELYGINILKMKLDSFNAQIEILKNNHYDQEWSEEIGGDKSYHNKQHQIYLDYQQYITDITARLNELQEKVDAIDIQIQENNSKQQDLAAKAQLEHYSWGFTDNELSDIYSLFRDTDYTDPAIEILETDTIDDIIDLYILDFLFKVL